MTSMRRLRTFRHMAPDVGPEQGRLMQTVVRPRANVEAATVADLFAAISGSLGSAYM
jgi:hypothetical protein